VASTPLPGAEEARPLLTAALITRDEAGFLPECLDSLSGVVDEIVVVDTGSSDDTIEIARSFGAVIAERPWTDDFSAARNASLDLATGEWILYIDADERLVDVNRDEIEALLASSDCVAYRVLLQPYSSTTAYREYRLWRNDPRIRFEGVIHEKVVPSIHAVSVKEGRPIGTADILLTHRGYEGDQSRKHRRNLPLLRRQLEIEPGNLFARHHLSRVLTGLGDEAAGEAELWKGLEVARAGGLRDELGALFIADLVVLGRNKGADVAPLIKEGRGAFPDNCALMWLEALHLMGEGRYEEALMPLEAILSFEVSSPPEAGPAYATRLLRELPLDAKGTCLMRLGDYEEAAEAYAGAAITAPSERSYRVKESLARARSKRAGQPAENASRREPAVA
jgi:glycosyltransferase involved in cell wall biosynthesis